jgi:eukaryotic-like serine/threonine-protein kinase
MHQDAARDLHGHLDGIARIENPWKAFDKLKLLGQTTYRETIREQLRVAATAQLPMPYQSIWELRVAGILNLNLDRLATRAFGEKHVGHTITEFTGAGIPSHIHVLRSPHPFIVNLHGDADDTDSWVFTETELYALREQEAYNTFIRTCVSSYTVLFVGLGADDIAAGGHLRDLADMGIDFGAHYWLTDRRDADTDQWAERAGIRVIRYQSRGNDHSDIEGFFGDLLRFVPPEDESAPPVAFDATARSQSVIPRAQDLVNLDAESIRAALNNRAAELLASGTGEAYEAYMRFLEEYDEAVHRAWYTSTTPGRNRLLGYVLESELARGAFGRVYRARSPEGREVAVKVLLGEVRTQPGFLQGFRRGVRSMEILSTNGVAGMVAYRQASEIPAFVVMELIDGPNLKEAVEARQLGDWNAVLKVGLELTSILRHAHALPERVLHRDVRPANVMLKNFWTDPDQWYVVVLDFDLSWHRGAFEQSVLQGTGIAGYLAPEQIQKRPRVSTRHAAVDSFGVGMTLYFTAAKEDPVPNQHLHADWLTTVERAVAELPEEKWRSLHRRFARVIVCATSDAQAQRWDMSQINNELARLREALLEPSAVVSAELLAEEIVSRCPSLEGYDWDDDRWIASRVLPSGVEASVRADESSRVVWLHLDWRDRGSQDWKSINRWIPSAIDIARGALERGGWQEVQSDRTAGTMSMRAVIRAEEAAGRLDALTRGVEAAVGAMRFD